MQARFELLASGRARVPVGGGGIGYCWWFAVLGADGDDEYSVHWRGPWIFNGGLGDVPGLATADTDGDGDDEVILSTGTRVDVLELDQATGEYSRILAVEGWGPWWENWLQVAGGDTDGDGRDEVIISQSSTPAVLEPEEIEGVRVYRRIE